MGWVDVRVKLLDASVGAETDAAGPQTTVTGVYACAPCAIDAWCTGHPHVYTGLFAKHVGGGVHTGLFAVLRHTGLLLSEVGCRCPITESAVKQSSGTYIDEASPTGVLLSEVGAVASSPSQP